MFLQGAQVHIAKLQLRPVETAFFAKPMDGPSCFLEPKPMDANFVLFALLRHRI